MAYPASHATSPLPTMRWGLPASAEGVVRRSSTAHADGGAPPHVASVASQADEARVDVATGATTVPAGLGWLLALRAADRLDTATHVRVTSFVAGPRNRWDHATRQQVAQAVREGATAVVDGHRVHERIAERRWLAWFPRPVGPRHAINVGGPVVDALAGLPGLRLARAHLVTRSWQAELVQAVAAPARTGPGARLLDDWVERGRAVSDADVRWACVVEVTADEASLVRAWAHGWGPTATSAVLGQVTDGRAGGHAGTPAAEARTALDDLAAATGARWSVSGPDSTGPVVR